MIHTIYLAVAGIGLLAASSAMGTSFQGLGDLSGGDFGSTAIGVSDDGSVIVGSGTTATGEQAFRWTKTHGMVSLGNLPNGSFKASCARDVSADGSVIVGYGDPVGSGWYTYKAFLWTPAGGMVEMGSLNESPHSIAFSVSADGSVVVGDAGQQAFRWTQEGGMKGLGVLPGYTNGGAVAVSADGSVATGSCYDASWTSEQTFRWTQSGGMQGLGHLPGYTDSFPNALSPDGSVIAGTCASPTSNSVAFRWSQGTGMVAIGSLPGRTTTHPGGVSADGSIIVGGSYFDPAHGTAFIWDAAHGMRSLQTMLQTDYAVDLTGWNLQTAFGITPDGSVIVGSGTNPSGQQEAFRVEVSLLPDPNGPVSNLSTGERFAGIQTAINYAQSGQVIQVAPGTYIENIQIAGKDLVLRSSDANDPNVTAVTILKGNGTDPIVKLQNCTQRCILSGLTIRGGGTGIWCSGGKPIIHGCDIVENAGSGIELLAGAQPTIDRCIIAANGGMGVKLVAPQMRGTSPALTNCTIAQNTECGLSGMVTLRNCILYSNGVLPGGPQIVTTNSQVTYCCVQGGFAGEGNIDADPRFARLGGWKEPNDANHPAAIWRSGDYHLQSGAGCWDPNRAAWVRDEKTSPCIDAGRAADAVGSEPSPNGGRIDMGAYGGTVQASKSLSVQFAETGQQLNRAIGRGVVLADFNGDGALDAFVVNQDDSRVYFGDGRGRFTDSGQRLSAVADASGKPAVFDVNGDGRIEVITGSTVWGVDAQGRFTAQHLSIESSENVDLGTMRFADLNGDGYLDLFALRNYTASRVYLNDGHGRFRDTGQRLGDGTIGTGQLAKISLGDIDGNGTIDAITAGWRWPPGNNGPCPNRVWLNDGAGNFHESGQLLEEGDSHVHGLDMADLNSDGRPDLVMGIQDAARSGRIYMNDGNGHFTGGPNLGGAGGENVALADFNGDGTLDVFVAHSTPPSRVWLNDGMGGLRDSGARLGSNCSWDVAAGDFNADGRIDAFVAGCIWTNSGLTPAPASIWLNTTPVSALPNR